MEKTFKKEYDKLMEENRQLKAVLFNIKKSIENQNIEFITRF